MKCAAFPIKYKIQLNYIKNTWNDERCLKYSWKEKKNVNEQPAFQWDYKIHTFSSLSRNTFHQRNTKQKKKKGKLH